MWVYCVVSRACLTGPERFMQCLDRCCTARETSEFLFYSCDRFYNWPTIWRNRIRHSSLGFTGVCDKSQGFIRAGRVSHAFTRLHREYLQCCSKWVDSTVSMSEQPWATITAAACCTTLSARGCWVVLKDHSGLYVVMPCRRRCRLQQTYSLPQLLLILRQFADEQQDLSARQFILQVQRNIRRNVATPRMAALSSLESPPLSEQELLRADIAERSVRSVGRLLAAGTDFTFLAPLKASCMQDFQTLLGPYFVPSMFCADGGRQYIAGILSCMLGGQVTLTDIARWFPNPSNQKLTVSSELSSKLLQHGMSWPPCLSQMYSCKKSYQYSGPGSDIRPPMGNSSSSHSMDSTMSLESVAECLSDDAVLEETGWSIPNLLCYA